MQQPPRPATALSQQSNHYTVLWLLSLVLLALLSSYSLAQIGIRLSAADLDRLEARYGEQAGQRLRAWQRLISTIQPLSEAEKVRQVNDFFNQVRFVDDSTHWQQKDYWATPVEFLISNGGDCEDFSIAKYYTLKEAGVDINKLSIAYVKALRLNQAHMVLTYYPTPRSVPLILDNLIADIKPASERPDLLHVYSFNGDNLWLSKKGQRSTLVGTSDRLAPWVKLKSRLNRNRINVD